MEVVDQLIESLKKSPSADVIESVTTQLLQQENDLKTRLHYTTTYLQFIVPVYASLKVSLKLKVRRLFHTCLGLSNILQQYKTSKNDVYFAFIKDLLLEQSLLVAVIESCQANKTQLSLVKSLFFGSKIYHTFEGKFVLDKYLSIVASQLVEACKSNLVTPDYILAYLTIHPIEAKFSLFDAFLTSKNFSHLTTVAEDMSNLQKRQFIASYLIPYLSQYCSVASMSTIATIIHSFNVSEIEESLLMKTADINNVEILQCVSFVISNKLKQVTNLLNVWGNEAYIKDTPTKHQEQLTTLILILTNYLSNDTKKELSMDKSFLSSITSRLSSNDTTIRSFGMMVAKSITNGEIEFDFSDDIVVKKPDIYLEKHIDFDFINVSGSMKGLSVDSQKVTVQLHDSEEDSDDDDDYEEDEAPPVFLKDILTRYQDNKITSVTKLLAQTIRLVRQKASFKMEVEFYSEELISVLAGLLNKYDEQGFEELKLNAMVSVIVVNPSVVSQVMTLLFTGDYSIQQRMILLSAISLSARELRGLDDDFIDKPEFDFPTNQIPQRKKKLVEEVQTPKIMEIKDDEEQGHALGNGTVTRISKKLSAPKPESKPNNFAKVAPKFFYPLANAWIEGIDMGGYNEMFLKHYLRTLELIVQAAYPCYGFEEMAEMFINIKENASNITI